MTIEFSQFFRESGPSGSETAPEARPKTALGFRELIAPTSLADFVEYNYGRRPLLCRSARHERAALFSLDRFRSALRRGLRQRPAGFAVHATFESGLGSDCAFFDVDYDQVGPVLDAGATVCVTNIHLVDAGLASLATRSRRDLQYCGAVGVNSYLSGRGGGFSMHYDARTATSIQIEGSKQWTYATGVATSFPLRNWKFRERVMVPVKRPDETAIELQAYERPPEGIGELETVELQPGDLLCVPAGAWHCAKAGGYSLAINLYLQHRPLHEVLARWMARALAPCAAWRGGLPPLVAGQPLPEGESSVHACIDDLQRHLEALRSYPGELRGLWFDEIAQADGGHPVADRGAPLVEPRDELSPTSEPPLLYCETRDERGQAVARLLAGSVELQADLGLAPIWSRLPNVDRFTPRDVMTWPGVVDRSGLEEHSVQVLLTRLVREGLLVRAGDVREFERTRAQFRAGSSSVI